MPYVFEFEAGDHIYRCNVPTQRCTHTMPNGQQCKKLCAIGTPFCWVHLQSVKHLRIKDSRIRDAGKGLFVSDTKAAADAIIYRKDDTICEYGGELIDETELNRRYTDEATAPYAVKIAKDQFRDAAGQRDVGSLANTKPGAQNARFAVYRGRATLKASRNIRNGEEIYLAYGGWYRMDEPGVTHRTVQRRRAL